MKINDLPECKGTIRGPMPESAKELARTFHQMIAFSIADLSSYFRSSAVRHIS
jgi:hypothetical protein